MKNKKETKKKDEALKEESAVAKEKDCKESSLEVETAPEAETSKEETGSIEERELKEMEKLREKENEAKFKEKIDELNDRLMRQMAEFDNFRKRSDKEKAMMFDLGAKSIIEKILPVIDNFERGLGMLSPEEISANSFADGMDKIYKGMMQTLCDAQVKPIEAVGKSFDPELHNAVMHGEDDAFGENTVVEEFQKGYTYKDMVVRHSMVKVVN